MEGAVLLGNECLVTGRYASQGQNLPSGRLRMLAMDRSHVLNPPDTSFHEQPTQASKRLEKHSRLSIPVC